MLGLLYAIPTILIVVARIVGHFDKKAHAKSVDLAVKKIMDSKCTSCHYSEKRLREDFAEKEARLAEREEKLTRNSRARFERQLLHEFSASDLHVFLPHIYPGKDPRLWPKEMQDRLFRSVRDGISIQKIISVEAKVIGSKGDEYTTTLEGCSCPDCDIRKIKPCKHMLYLYLHLGHAAYSGADARRYTKQIQQASDASSKKKNTKN